jgi:hypothetical protein
MTMTAQEYGMRQDVRQFANDVSAIMKREYGLTWQDAAGDLQPLENGLTDGLSPQEFVELFAAQYGLAPLSDVRSATPN